MKKLLPILILILIGCSQPEPLNNRYKKFQEKFDEDDEELKDKLMKESEMVILSENLKQK